MWLDCGHHHGTKTEWCNPDSALPGPSCAAGPPVLGHLYADASYSSLKDWVCQHLYWESHKNQSQNDGLTNTLSLIAKLNTCFLSQNYICLISAHVKTCIVCNLIIMFWEWSKENLMLQWKQEHLTVCKKFTFQMVIVTNLIIWLLTHKQCLISY